MATSLATADWETQDATPALGTFGEVPLEVLVDESEYRLRAGWIHRPSSPPRATWVGARHVRKSSQDDSTQPIGCLSILASQQARQISELAAIMAPGLAELTRSVASIQRALVAPSFDTQRLSELLSAHVAESLSSLKLVQSRVLVDFNRSLSESLSTVVKSFTPAFSSAVLSSLALPATTELLPTTSDPEEAVELVREWFDVSYDELAQITGISKGTFFYWKRTGANPYRTTLRPLWRVYSIAEAAVRHLGQPEAAEWLRSGDPSPLARLASGDVQSVEEEVRSMVPRQQDLRPGRFFAAELRTEEAPEPIQTASPKRSSRKPVRRRLGGS